MDVMKRCRIQYSRCFYVAVAFCTGFIAYALLHTYAWSQPEGLQVLFKEFNRLKEYPKAGWRHLHQLPSSTEKFDSSKEDSKANGTHLHQLPVEEMTKLNKSSPEKNDFEKIRRYTNELSNTTEVSVITAYFNLGELNKQSGQGKYNPELYKRWMVTFGRLDNPLVVFTDTEETANYFKQLRARYPPSRTTITLVRREELWSFRLADEIRTVYSLPGYPKHHPNTVNPLYSCAMHAKFELVQRVIRQQLYQTPFVAWLDIGLFRDETQKNETIHLTVPTDLDGKRVAYSQVSDFEKQTPMKIVRENKVWIGGASFLGTPEVVDTFCSEYRRAVRKLLDWKIMSTDQQVIYSMFQPSFNFTPKIQLQTYRRGWFGVGYIMKDSP